MVQKITATLIFNFSQYIWSEVKDYAAEGSTGIANENFRNDIE